MGVYSARMNAWFRWIALGLALFTCSCALRPATGGSNWQAAIDRQTQALGYQNWIVVTEASFPALNRPGIRQVIAPVEVPEALDYVLQAMERTQHVRPRVYVARELRSVENDFAPGIDVFRQQLKGALHGHETTELDQQALLTLLEDANRTFDVLLVRTQTALPYTSVFLELQHGYWDGESETRLRDRIRRERMERLVRPMP